MTLYKYLCSQRTDVLEHCEIRFTQPGALNDPFELRPRFNELLSQADLLEGITAAPIDLSEQVRQVHSMLPEKQRNLLPLDVAEQFIRATMTTESLRAAAAANVRSALKHIQDYAAPIRQQMFDILNKTVGILSLSEVPDHELMWAHYAESYAGFVIGFNEEHGFFKRRRSQHDECYHLRRVIYSDSVPAATMASLESDSLFVTKGSRWEYEREWRMMVPLKDATSALQNASDSIYLFALPSEAVSSVILGPQMELGVELKLRELLAGRAELRHVALGRAILDHNERSVKVVIPESVSAQPKSVGGQ